MHVGFIGSGAVGAALAALFESAGHQVRAAERDAASVRATVDAADVVVLAVPFHAVEDALAPAADALRGKTLVDATNPVAADWAPVVLDGGISGAEAIAARLPETAVVKAFNTVFADTMTPSGLDRQGRALTTFVASDSEAAAATVATLAKSAGFDTVETGALAHARYLEGMAHLNIAIALGGGGTDAGFIFDRAAPE